MPLHTNDKETANSSHNSSHNDSEKEGKTQKEKETKSLERSKKVEQELANYRRPFEAAWKDYDNAYYGKQHRTSNDKKRVKNHIFKIIESEVPILTDSEAATSVQANTEDQQDTAQNLEKAILFVYKNQNMDLLLQSAALKPECASM